MQNFIISLLFAAYFIALAPLSQAGVDHASTWTGTLSVSHFIELTLVAFSH